MAGVTALRDAAREAVFSCGGRGFVRFLSEGEALLLSDAPRRIKDEVQRKQLIHALRAAGFSCRIGNDLAYITPDEARLRALCDAQPNRICVGWESPLFEAQALCHRLLREPSQAFDGDAQRLVLEAARLLWQPKEKVLMGLSALRARIAARQREGKRSGLHEAGRLLCGWLKENGH